MVCWLGWISILNVITKYIILVYTKNMYMYNRCKVYKKESSFCPMESNGFPSNWMLFSKIFGSVHIILQNRQIYIKYLLHSVVIYMLGKSSFVSLLRRSSGGFNSISARDICDINASFWENLIIIFAKCKLLTH